MKNIVLIFALSFAGAFLFSSCDNEEDDKFDNSSAVRLEQAKKDYISRLSSSENGWAMEYYPTTNKGVKGYTLLVNFHSDGSVTVAMKNELSDNRYVDAVSAWDVIADNGPVLTFNSYNPYIHIFSSPEDIPGTSDKDEQGLGYEGDYEFIVVDAPENAQTIMLKGKKRGTYIRLTRIPVGIDWQDYYREIDSMTSLLFANSPHPLYLKCGGDLYTAYDGGTSIFNIVKPGGDQIADEDYYPFLVTREGLRLYKSFACPTGGEVQEFKLSEDKSKLVSVENENIWIQGPEPADLYTELIDGGKRYYFDKDRMCDALKVIYERVESSFSEKKMKIRKMAFGYRTTEKSDVLYIQTTNAEGYLFFAKEIQPDGSLKYNYLNDGNANGLIFYGFDGMAEFVGMLSSVFKVNGGESDLNLSSCRLTDVSDNSNWFILSL